MNCPDCDGPVVEEEVTRQFDYGWPGYVYAKTLSATAVAFVCKNPLCGTVTTDSRMEKAEIASVAAYLKEIF